MSGAGKVIVYQANIIFDQTSIQQMNNNLLKLSEQIRNRAIRPAVQAATRPIERSYRNFLRRHRSKKANPVRRIKGTDVYVRRPHLDEVVTSKVWRIPDGTGYIGYIGARSNDARHAHLLENPTVDRYTKTGQYRGRMPGYYLLQQAMNVSMNEARYQLETVLASKINQLDQSHTSL